MRAVPFSPAIVSGQGLPSFFWILLLLMFSCGAIAQAPADPHSGTFLLTNAAGETHIALHADTDVTMDIRGMTARVFVRQTFSNATNEWQEGSYLFPLPDDSAVNAMRMLVGTREIIGEVRERVEAQRVYDAARSEGRKAALVEQQRPNLFTQRVANIAPGESISVELQYIQALRFEDGRFRLRFPMAPTPRYMPGDAAASSIPDGITPNAADTLTLHVSLDAGVPLASVGSTTHDMAVVAISGKPGRFEMDLRAGAVRMDRDLELEWAPQAGRVPQTAAFIDTRDDGTYMQLMLLPPQDAVSTTPQPREVIIVLDSSGSMDGPAMVQAKQSVQLALNGLRAGDSFNIIDFDDRFEPLFPDSMPASAENIAFARRFVERVEAGGGTEIKPALQYALEQTPVVADGRDLLRQIVFVTDGGIGDEDAVFELISTRLGDARLFMVGIGSAPNAYFMRKAADTGRGSYVFIDDTKRVTERMSALLHRLENAVMTDLAIEWPAGVDAEYYPQRIPDLYRGEPLFVTARLHGRVPAQQELIVSGTLDGRNWLYSVKVDTHNGESTMGLPPSMSSLASYWARQKIEGLLNAAFAGKRGDAAFKEELRRKVLDVALPFQLLSPYTSFVAVERRTPLTHEADTKSTKQLLAQQVPFPATATPAGAWLLAGSLALLCGALSLLSLRREKEQAHA